MNEWEEDAAFDLAEPVVVDGVGLRIFTSIDDVLDMARLLEDEDPFTGIVPVEAAAVEVELDFPEPDSSTVAALSVWSKDQKGKMLSKVSCEALDAIFTLQHGERWWRHEPEVLLEDLAKVGFILDVGGIHKVRTLDALMDAPIGQCPFYTDPYTFLWACPNLIGRPFNWGDMAIPTPVEMAVAINVLQTLRPGAFEDDVLAAMAGACFYRGVWALPGVLAPAQEALYRMCQVLDIPVDAERVNKVKQIAQQQRDFAFLAARSTDTDQLQALEFIDLEERIALSTEAGATERDEVLELRKRAPE